MWIAPLTNTPVLTVHVGTYYRSIRRPQPSCQSFHLDSIPGAQNEQTVFSRSAVTCGASHCLHSRFLQMSAEKRGDPVRSVVQ